MLKGQQRNVKGIGSAPALQLDHTPECVSLLFLTSRAYPNKNNKNNKL